MATAEQDRALMALYEMLKGRTGYTGLDEAGRRDYKRRKQSEARAAQRAAQRAAAEAGSPMPTADAVRDALADVALRMLSQDSIGADMIRQGLAEAFPGRPGVPGAVTRKARAGSLKPRLLRSL